MSAKLQQGQEDKKGEDRKGIIGSSDIAAVMGLSRWCTPLQLWALKTGRLEPEDLSDNEAVIYGSKLEDFVAKEFSEQTGLSVRNSPKKYTHPKYIYMKAQVDRLITGTDELLECKTCSAWKAKEWEGEEIPQEYILQVMWQLGITGRRVGWIAVLIGGQAFRYKKIEYDQQLFDSMVASAVKFWEMVKEETPPMAMGDDNFSIIELYPESGEHIQLVEEMNDSIGLLQQTKGSINELYKTKDELEAKIKQVIGDNLGIKTGEYIVTWRKQFKKEYIVKASETRVLRVRKEKQDGDERTDKRAGQEKSNSNSL
jgi:putative phage-type endonuclease